jgi:G:T-mismatch repair DNA endonuclease (very short patch repair protein)
MAKLTEGRWRVLEFWECQHDPSHLATVTETIRALRAELK